MGVLQRIETHLEETGLAPTRFGRIAANDPRLVLDMRLGRNPRARTLRRIEMLIGNDL